MKIKETLLSHRNLPWILLALATAFAFFQIIPTLKDSIYHFSGDRLFHFSKELCMAEKISGGDYYFSVYPHNFGMPLLQLYPWVFDFMVVGLHFFSLGTISVVLSHNVISAIIYFSYPAVIFYLLRTFRFPKLICGVGALLSLAPISGWGASFNAYYRTGLAAQSVSNPLFPFTIILLYIFVHKNRFSLPLFLMSFLFMVSHLSSVFMWAIVAAVFFISHFKITKLRYDAILFKKVAIVSAVLFAVTMFCYVPMYEFSRSGVYFKPYPGRTTTPVFTGFNAKQFVDSLLKGEMFDNAGKTSFVRALAKEGQGFRWAVNIMHERFGLFTIFIALGLITCLVNRKRPRYNFFSVGLLMSAILLLGEDEVVIFQYLKLPSSIQYLRFIGVMDFFSVCVGAIGFYGLMVFLRERIRLKYNRHLKEKALSLLLVVPILIFIYPERFFSGRFYPYRQYAVARELTKVKAELTKYSKNYSRATFYKKSDYDPLLLSGRGDWAFILPMITDWLVAQMYVAGCHNYIPENEAVLRLFNIKYLLTETQYKAELDAKNVNRDFSVLGITEHFMLLENKAGYTYLEPLGRKPLLFITDFDFWSAANMMWFDMFGRRKIEDVFLLKVKPGDLKKIDAEDSNLIITDLGLVSREMRKEVVSYAERGGQIHIYEPPGWLAEYPSVDADIHTIEVADCGLTKMLSTMYPPLDAAKNPPPAATPEHSITEYFLNPGHYKAHVSSAEDNFYVFKCAYFKNWMATVDGEKTDVYHISPCLMAIYLKKGRHDVEFIWRTTPLMKFGNSVSAITIAGVLLAGMTARKRRRPQGAYFLAQLKTNDGFASITFAAAAVSCIAYLYVKESVFLEPPVTKPGIVAKENPAGVMFQWQKPYGKRLLYDFELYEGPPADKKIAFKVEKTARSNGFVPNLKKDQVYYWRLRPEWRGRKYRWGPWHRFSTGYACIRP